MNCGSSQDSCEHGVGGRSGGLSPSSLSAHQSSEILGAAREAAQAKAGCSQNACGVEDVLQLLRILYIIGGDSASNARTLQEGRKTWFCSSDRRWTETADRKIIYLIYNKDTIKQ